MKLRSNITINGKVYEKGAEISPFKIYPFFLIHMAIFGGSGFLMAYGRSRAPVPFLYLHGGIAILVYTIFYLTIFGLDEVKWMFINGALGVLGIYAQVGWILSLAGRNIRNYPLSVHVVPFLYLILYTFLVRHFLLDLFGAREDPARKRFTEYAFVAGWVVLDVVLYLAR